jgi:hypothetical protein
VKALITDLRAEESEFPEISVDERAARLVQGARGHNPPVDFLEELEPCCDTMMFVAAESAASSPV